MALAATTIFEVRTTGSDTNNGGAFDPGQTAGMLTDGAATSATSSAPVFTSASYSFVAGDAGAWLFIASGTNWTPGWYQIASVSGGAATLSAAVGAAIIGPTSTMSPSTSVGCATVASPTAATWSIDYSQQAAAQFTYTDLASAGAGLTVSSAATPFQKWHVGNALVVTGGTNFTAGRYVIASVSVANVATVVGAGNITSGIGASGTGGMGGAFASPAMPGGFLVASNRIFIKTGTYTSTSASTNISNGCLSIGVGSVSVEGYDTVRGDLNALGATGTRPTITADGVITTFTLINHTTFNGQDKHLILNGNSRTSSRGLSVSSNAVVNVKAMNCTNSGFSGAGNYVNCWATGCSTQPAFTGGQGVYFGCVASGNTVTGFNSASNLVVYVRCLSANNSGASSDGFAMAGSVVSLHECTSYGNGRDGVRVTGGQPFTAVNNLLEGNSGFGINSTSIFTELVNNAYYNNTSGATSLSSSTRLLNIGAVTLTGSAFTNAAGGDFSLNTTAGGGAACRAAGFPGAFPGVSTTGYLDIGAAQHADTASGGFSGGIFGG